MYVSDNDTIVLLKANDGFFFVYRIRIMFLSEFERTTFRIAQYICIII